MFDWLIQALANTTATVVFFSVFLLGVTFSAVSVLFGGDHDADSDLGDADADGDFDGGDHGADHGDAADGDGGVHGMNVGVLSVRGMALLATGFGGAGFIAQTQTHKVLFSTAVATVVGYGFAFAVLYVMRIFKSQQANSLIQTRKAIGTTGVVAISIPRGDLGEVRVNVDGVELTGMARSSGGQAIPSGTLVRVDDVNGGTFFVSPQQDRPQGGSTTAS